MGLSSRPGSADVSDEEKQEVEVLHQNEFIILK